MRAFRRSDFDPRPNGTGHGFGPWSHQPLHPGELGSFAAVMNRLESAGRWRPARVVCWLHAEKRRCCFFNSVHVTVSTICWISFARAQTRVETK
jgi:hypothetical protein